MQEVHSGVKKAHDWEVDQLADLSHTTHTMTTQHVTQNRGRHCRDVDLTDYLANVTGPVSLVLHLLIDSSSTTVSEVVLTLILMDTYITLMI